MADAERRPDLSEVREVMDRVLVFEGFHRSRRLQRFLTYVVEKSFAGEADEIKEYDIALAVFDRDPSFDPRNDTIVRVEARRLRQALSAYEQGPGRGDPFVIELPKGGYVPTIRYREERPAVAVSNPRRTSWLAVSSALVLGVALGVGWFAWRTGTFTRHVPAIARIDGSHLTVRDAKGRLCWEKQFPHFDPAYESLILDKSTVADIDGDGRVEVLFELLPANAAEVGGSLLCFESDGTLRWQRHLGARKTFGGRTYESTYVGRIARPVKVNGRPMVLSVANMYLWNPSQVALLDPKDGRVVEEYWHPGSIYFVSFADLDNDGAGEVVFGAINNPGEGLGYAAMGALTLPFSRAPRRTPAAGERPPLTGGGELFYALLPRPDTLDATGWLPIPMRMYANPGERRFLIETPIWPESGGAVFYLNYRLEVEEFHGSDNFAAVHEQLRKRGLLDHALTPAERARLARGISFPFAPEGNSVEVRRMFE